MKYLIAACLLVALCSAGVLRRNAEMKNMEKEEKAEMKKMGEEEKKEMHEDEKKSFEELDGDKDGIVTPAEVGALLSSAADNVVKMFMTDYDTNKDGAVDKAEFDAVQNKKETKADMEAEEKKMEGEMKKDGLGKELEEMKAEEKKEEGEFKKEEKEEKKEMAEIEKEEGPEMKKMEKEEEKDGKKEKEELMKEEHKGFDKVDANGDGKVTPQELKAMLSNAAKKTIKEFMETFDTDKNGGVDKKEFENVLAELEKGDKKEEVAVADIETFDSLDADNDGKILANEVVARGKAEGAADATAKLAAKEFMDDYDADKDGAVTRQEYDTVEKDE